MNKLKTYNDGSYMPLWQKDLEFLQEAFRIPFIKLCETLLGKTSGIITGCKLTKDTGFTHISEGWVLLFGEIIHCPAQTAPLQPQEYVLTKTDGYDAAGDKVFKISDGTEVRRTYYTPYMRLETGVNLNSSFIVLNDKKDLMERLHEILSNFNYELKNFDSYSYSGGTTIFYAKIGKQVHVLSLSGKNGTDAEIHEDEQGSVIKSSDNDGSKAAALNKVIFTFPDGYRPARDTFFSYQENNTGTIFLGKISAADGKMYIGNNRNITAAAFSYLTT